jgi:hypothetical protein
MIIKVISGGQTGADQAGLRAAKTEGYQTGGWACKGWKTEAGPAPWLADFGLQECPIKGYPTRTHWNVRDSSMTLIIGVGSAGTNLTQRLCGPLYGTQRPWLWVPWPEAVDYDPITKVRDWLWTPTGDIVLNVAGNREETNPGIGDFVEDLLGEALIPF